MAPGLIRRAGLCSSASVERKSRCYRYTSVRDHGLPLFRAAIEGLFAAEKLDAIVYPTSPRRPALLTAPPETAPASPIRIGDEHRQSHWLSGSDDTGRIYRRQSSCRHFLLQPRIQRAEAFVSGIQLRTNHTALDAGRYTRLRSKVNRYQCPDDLRSRQVAAEKRQADRYLPNRTLEFRDRGGCDVQNSFAVQRCADCLSCGRRHCAGPNHESAIPNLASADFGCSTGSASSFSGSRGRLHRSDTALCCPVSSVSPMTRIPI